MYNLSQDLIFNCLNFQSLQDHLYIPPTQQTPKATIFNPRSAQPLSAQLQDQYGKIQMLDPTSHIPPDSIPAPFFHRPKDESLDALRVRRVREIRQIFCSSVKRVMRLKLLKGQPYETQNIGKHLRSITLSHLIILRRARILDLEQEAALKVFQYSNGSFSDFSQLFSVESLQLKCQAFFSSRGFIFAILSVTKMSFESRLKMIKYGQRLRKIAYRQTFCWKMEEK